MRFPWTRCPVTQRQSVRLLVEELESREVPAILTVGAGQTYATMAAAAAVVQDGDTVRIAAGTLSGANAYSIWDADNLIIEGMGGSRSVLDATGYNLPNRKGILTIRGDNVTVRNIEFKGAHDTAGVDRNWAGIRQEGTTLTVSNCYFHHNDDGILAGANAASDITVEYSEFAQNGYGDGLSHSIYIGDVRSFTLRHSYMHDTGVGHDVKSRAATNSLLYNWIGGTGAGSESYEINLPDGGTAYIIGNVIRQDATSQNSTIVDWGSENNGGANASQGFYFINNTVVNDGGTGGSFVRMLGGVYPADVRIQNNIFAGSGVAATMFAGPAGATQSNNLKVANPGFVNPGAFNYRLTSAATSAINQGVALGSANGVSLVPVYQYVATANREARPVVGVIDIGAYEYGTPPANQPPTVATAAAASPSPVNGTTTALSVLGADDGGAAALTYTWATTGTPPAAVSFSANGTNAARNSTATFIRAGAYNFQVTIRDAANLAVTSNVSVTVNQTLTSIVVTPGSVTLGNSATQQFAASGRDQFGQTLTAQPSFTWSIASGVGAVNASGLYTAPPAGSGAASVRAASASVNAAASVTVQGSTAAPPPAFQQSANKGLVIMEAENFAANLPQGGQSWVVSGATMTTPNSGVTINTGYAATSPQLTYRVHFATTGVHYVWVRARGPASGNSVHVGLDGQEVASADRIKFGRKWGWSRGTLDKSAARIDVATVGLHTINLWMREDGASVDKLLLTTKKGYKPSGKGPAQSAMTIAAGLNAAYYDNANLTGTSVTRIDAGIHFNWGAGSPDAAIAADTFSARWTGRIAARYTETYTFHTTSDDGVRLWVNGQLLIDQWNNHSATTHSGTISLQAGELYDLRLEYYDNTGGAQISLEWSSASQAREIVPASRLFVG